MSENKFKFSLSLVVPCYNEQEVLPQTYKILNNLTQEILKDPSLTKVEMLFVNDGSVDKTLEILTELAEENQQIKIISLSNNFGHQAALLAGMKNASGDAIITLDADLQDPPETIKSMLNEFKNGNQIVYAVRDCRATDSFLKRFTAHSFYKLMKLMKVDIVYDHADFRLVSNTVVKQLKEFREANIFLRGIFPYMGFKHSIVKYKREERFAGKTKYPMGKMIGFALDGITSFSQFPLKLVYVAGAMTFIFSMLLSGWVFWIWMSDESIPGWASTLLPMSIFSGFQILFIALIGEYVGKIYMETKQRPPYIIENIYSSKEENSE